MKYAIIIVLLVFVAVLADRVVREENQRNALILGMCRLPGPVDVTDFDCLNQVHTRSSWLSHLYYGVITPLPRVDWNAS